MLQDVLARIQPAVVSRKESHHCRGGPIATDVEGALVEPAYIQVAVVHLTLGERR